MRRSLSILSGLFALGMAVPDRAAVVFVAPQAAGPAHDGTSWQTAFLAIQPALDAAKPGDEVWVREGIYGERITFQVSAGLYGGFQGTENSRNARDPRVHVTVLDGGKTGTVVTVPDVLAGAIVDGFTIRNGYVFGYSTSGGGILSSGLNVIIAHNVIENNTAASIGPGPVALGGGISIESGSASLLNNVIRNNTVNAYYTGSNEFAQVAYAYGAGVYVRAGSFTAANNLITGNTLAARAQLAFASGAGLYVLNGVGDLIANNTIAGNVGDGISLDNSGSNPVLANNVIAFNTVGVSSSAPAAMSHNDIFGNRFGDFSGKAADPTGTNGNIKADPLFANAAGGDYHLQPLSPSRDAGDDTAVVGLADLDGLPRIAGPHVDMGPYELPINGLVTIGDAASALRIAAGLNASDSSLFNRLNVDAPDARRLNLADAVRLLRKALEVDSNP